ncbi:uncharacterized protein BP5553_10501 [Venustampulla echinocandica]|uniref:Uncharacterized protein n=1 Tax=Venustampulla echinocandica TaxID=2656787 RepID=A0A370T9I5_9HELO|nr:uncharacterized protein BP5553_10501 [Venustampulla echinocandica]RDL30223.1 hypothetical protein BP5553_10501 [Venustampulla echinocandica]
MAAVEIHNTTEAKQRLYDALDILDAISAYSINHQLPSNQLFDIDVRKRLQSLYTKPPSPIYHRLEESDELSKDEKKSLSPYCYKIEVSAGDFDDVLGGLEAHYKQMNAQNLASKGELIDTIIRGGVSKTIRSVAGILDVIGSLALWHIREVEARTLATQRGHKLVSQEDKSNAATEMWQYLSSYNSDADRAKLDARISAGIRWNRFLGRREIGTIVAVYKLPLSLKFSTKLIVKLALIVTDMPGILDRAKKATPCLKKLLDSRLGPWAGSKKRELPVQRVPELSPKRRGPGTEAESGTSGGNSNSIWALLNAAEHITAATQGQQLPSVRSSSTTDRIALTPPESLVPAGSHLFASEGVLHSSGWDTIASGQPEIRSDREESRGLESQSEALDPPRKRMRVDSFSLSNENGGSIVTAEASAGVNLQAENVSSLDSSVSQLSGGPMSDQGGTTKETSPGDANFSVPRDDHHVEASEMKIAVMAEMDKLESPLGGYVFKGINTSCMRYREEERRCMRFTDTVRLHICYHRVGEDIKLELRICRSIGEAILRAMRSVKELMDILGDYLFEGMKTSNWMKEQERKEIYDFSNAVYVSFLDEDNGSDCKVEVLLGCKIGLDFYKNAFP